MGFGASSQVYLGRDENSYKCSPALASSSRLATSSSWSPVSGNTRTPAPASPVLASQGSNADEAGSPSNRCHRFVQPAGLDKSNGTF